MALKARVGGSPAYFVETAELSSVVPEHAIGSDDGVGEIIRVANQTRGNRLEEA